MPDFTNIATKDVVGEKEIFKTRPSIFILLGRLVPVLIGTIGLMLIFIMTDVGSIMPLVNQWLWLLVLIVGMVITLIIILDWFSTIYRVTNKRIEYRFGILGFKESELAIEDIQSVEDKQSFVGILLNYGDITVRTAAKSEREVTLSGIDKPGPRSRQIEDLAALSGE